MPITRPSLCLSIDVALSSFLRFGTVVCLSAIDRYNIRYLTGSISLPVRFEECDRCMAIAV